MIDVSVSYNRYAFLGDEFLTWLWFIIDTDPNLVAQGDDDGCQLAVGNRVVIVNRVGADTTETITIKGDDPGLEEGLISLKKGALVSELNLVLTIGDNDWRFSLKGESLHLGSLKPPESGAIESEDELEGAVLERIYLIERAYAVVRSLFEQFTRLRVSDQWEAVVVPKMGRWVVSDGSEITD